MKTKNKIFNLLLIGSLLCAATLSFTVSKPVHAYTTDSEIFINEIHYDNTGTDANEGIEIAGPAGTDLTGWILAPYNGNGGLLYSSTALSGIIPDQQNRYGTLFFAIAGLQNGAPDGIALIKPDNSVVMFLSYEGSFTATDGLAIGLTSTDIGVLEVGTEALGLSLQLSGAGDSYNNFSWGITSSSNRK